MTCKCRGWSTRWFGIWWECREHKGMGEVIAWMRREEQLRETWRKTQ